MRSDVVVQWSSAAIREMLALSIPGGGFATCETLTDAMRSLPAALREAERVRDALRYALDNMSFDDIERREGDAFRYVVGTPDLYASTATAFDHIAVEFANLDSDGIAAHFRSFAAKWRALAADMAALLRTRNG